jgi:hypothetical protein
LGIDDLAGEEMTWPTLQYTKSQVDRAWGIFSTQGDDPDQLFASDQYLRSVDAISNWRSSHSFPLNTFTVGLKRRAKDADPDALVAQRIKRLSSIAAKLDRFPTMQLSQMQDIGGCRAIVATISDVHKLIAKHKSSDIRHKLVKEPITLARQRHLVTEASIWCIDITLISRTITMDYRSRCSLDLHYSMLGLLL